MPEMEWLTARPIAHRGLHDGKSSIENTASAFAAAVAQGYGIECDLQLTADGEAMVHHDDALGRLTEGNGRLDAMTAAQLKRVPMKVGSDRLIALGDLCDLVGGRSTLLIELKSRYDCDRRLVDRTADVLSSYSGPAAVMSFDPRQMTAFREIAPALSRGIVAESHHHGKRADSPGPGLIAYAWRLFGMRPQFVAYSAKDLPSALTGVARRLFQLPILAWTVHSETEWQEAKPHADQMIFEGFRP
jgi:glycerophosphoryl diester phosphodiesterase